MASASDADLAKMVQNYQELQEAQKTTSESMADLETGMSNAMDEIAQNVADSVADMNLSDKAKESAQATIQGFVDGAEGMLPRVQSVFSKSPPLLPPHWQEQAVATAATSLAMQSARNPLRPALPSSARKARSWSTSTAAKPC